MTTAQTVLGWEIVIFIGILEALILGFIVTGKIDLSMLIAEKTGEASLSRFQFLIFTFVIAAGFFLLTFSGGDEMAFPEVPEGVWALLGISGGSYIVSKGIQKSGGGKGG